MSAPMAPWALDVVHAVVALGAAVVLPVGLRVLGDRDVPRPSSAAWLIAGTLAAVAVWLPVGPTAAVLAVPFAAACAVLALCAVRAAAGRRRGWWSIGTAVALAAPAVGATALVAERAGWGLLGFSGDELTLTAPHMLFAGFGACLVVGLLARAVPSRAATAAAVLTPAGVLVVLLGYFVSDAVELVGAVLLTAGVWCAAGAAVASTATGSRPLRRVADVGVVAAVVSMALALWWATGEATGMWHPALTWMVATHGVLNAGGVVLCLVLALRSGRTPAAAPDGVDDLDYAPVGATRTSGRPAGYRHLAVRHLILSGADESDHARVVEALVTGQVHAAARVEVDVEGGRATPGARVVTRIGVGRARLTEPCRVVWSSPDGFGYGTVPGHLFRGEEAFTVELDGDGLWFVAVAYSVPAVGWVRALGPLVVVGQRLYLRLLAHGAHRVAAARVHAGLGGVAGGAR
ncbi:YndJ family transporter [Cellulomonas sp.]|uniref:YndJ family transporter n=1 Tax=Cellulomonas sp. TaxID=40001 RepID=UPI001B2D3A7C|nr:YndJ family transporter [Cellulomonas sp.]MBO9556529.1 YndJ family transporter [Cellulomonas sp.]